MKNWWLELYTLPSLKNIGKSFLVVFAVNLLIGLLAPQLSIIGVMANFYVFRKLKVQMNKSLGYNIEFHKLHVPFVKLRKAFYLDFFIQWFCLNIGFLISYAIAVQFKIELSFDIHLMPYFALFCMSFLPLRWIGGIPKGRFSQYNLLDPNIGKLKNFSISIFCFIFVFVSYFLAILSDFSLMSFVYTFGVLVCVGHFWFLIKAVFHQEMKNGTPVVFFKYTFRGLAVSLCSFLFLSFATRPLVHVSTLDPIWRNSFFLFSGPLAPELNFEEAKLFMATEESNIGLILSKTPGIEHLPVGEIFKNPSSYDYFEYVSSIHPSSENMLYILEKIHQSKKPTFHDYATSQIIVSKWPKSSKFPDHLLVKKIRKDESPLSERLPAGK
jgi:hypothetical protein